MLRPPTALLTLCLVLAGGVLAGVRIPALGPQGDVRVPPFGVGERFTFEIKYGFVSAGTAVMGIPELVQERGYDCYRIVSVAESNSFFSAFFTVRDEAESRLETKRLVPLRFEKRLREGNYRAHDLVVFDPDRHVAIYEGKDDRVVPLAADAQDILSSLYYVRMMDLSVGKSVFIENHADKKNYPLEIKVLKKERVTVPAGEFSCVVVEPVMRASGLFRHKGTLTVWLTDDERHIPVLMKSKVVIGSVAAVLTELELAEP
jgi:hypothetical protein